MTRAACALSGALLLMAGLAGCDARGGELQVAPLVEQAVRAYREGDTDRVAAVLEQLDALQPPGATDADLKACTANGYLMRRIRYGKMEVEHLADVTVGSMSETARYLYLEDSAQGRARLLDKLDQTGWPDNYTCEKAKDGYALGDHDNAESIATRRALQKMQASWRSDLESASGPEYLKLRLKEAAAQLAQYGKRSASNY